MASNEYNASSIKVLEGLEAVRKRPGMYIGSTGERGLHHLVYEVVDNAVDEALAGYCTDVVVTLQADGGVRVEDNGRGIPVGRHPVEKRPAVEVVLTTLHAGGKFDGKSYAVSGGLHGVGVSVVNALSSRLEVLIKTDGYLWFQPYAGSRPAAPLERRGPTKETGTTVTFWADPTIFTETTTYSYETLYRRLQEMAFLNKGLRIVLRDERREESAPVPEGSEAVDVKEADAAAAAPPRVREVEFRYENGIVDFVAHLNSAKEPAHKTVITFEGKGEGIEAEVAMQWKGGNNYAESVYTFANTINTHEGGTHEEGFRDALTRAVNSYAKDANLLKAAKANGKGGDERLQGDDIREGLTAIVSVKLAQPQFEGQTKTKLGNTEAKSFVSGMVYSGLKDWLESHPGESKGIIMRAIDAQRARIAARAARDLTRRKSLLESTSLPGKLADCQSTDPSKCEVYVVEGDSAGGCFSGDTLVATVGARPLSLRQLANDWEAGRTHFGYATDESGDVVVVPLEAPRRTRRSAELVEVELDGGQKLRCTPDHLFRLRDGGYARADRLQPGDSLMPLYRRHTVRGEQPGSGYEMVWANGRERWEHTHHLADAYNLETGATHYKFGPVRHHVDFDKTNNDPRNLRRMTQDGHIALHASQAQRTLGGLWQDPDFRARKMLSLSENARRQWEDPAYRALKSEQVRRQRQDPELNERLLDGFRRWVDGLDADSRQALESRLYAAQQAYWAEDEHRRQAEERTRAHFRRHPDLAEQLRDLALAQWDDEELRSWRSATTRQWWAEDPERAERHSGAVRRWLIEHPDFRAGRSEAMARRWEDPDWRKRVEQGLQKWRATSSPEDKAALIRNGNRRKALRLLSSVLDSGDIRTAYEAVRSQEAPTALSYARLLREHYDGDVTRLVAAARNHNHAVVGVRPLDVPEDVYDLTVSEYANFALESGIFVHNSAKGGRDPQFQAILPIRGKILNVEKARIDRVLKNTEVQAMITALGTGIHDEFDHDKLRYHKIVLMADADVDGQHIRTLLLTLLFRFMRPLIEHGNVFLAQPPLYKIKWGKDDWEYAYSDRERDGLVAQGQEAGRKLPKDAIQRFKGLGEMNHNELWDTTMDPARRVLLRVTLDDAAVADELFSTLMGEDVEGRRNFIQRNAKDVRFLDI